MRISSPGRRATPVTTRRVEDEESSLRAGRRSDARPFVHQLSAHPEPETRDRTAEIEVLDVQRVPSGRAVVAQCGGAFRRRAGDCLAAGRGLPGRDVADGVAFQLHRFGFGTAGMTCPRDPSRRRCRRCGGTSRSRHRARLRCARPDTPVAPGPRCSAGRRCGRAATSNRAPTRQRPPRLRSANRRCTGSRSCRNAVCRCTERGAGRAADRRGRSPAIRRPWPPPGGTGRCSRCPWRRCGPCPTPFSSALCHCPQPLRSEASTRDAVVIAHDVGERLQAERAGVVFEGAPGGELDAR